MVRLVKLRQMLKAESKVNWYWNNLTKLERAVYRKAKEAPVFTDDMRNQAQQGFDYHTNKINLHAAKSKPTGGRQDAVGDKYLRSADKHGQAAVEYRYALNAHKMNNHPKAVEHFNKAIKFSGAAKAHDTNLKI